MTYGSYFHSAGAWEGNHARWQAAKGFSSKWEIRDLKKRLQCYYPYAFDQVL